MFNCSTMSCKHLSSASYVYQATYIYAYYFHCKVVFKYYPYTNIFSIDSENLEKKTSTGAVTILFFTHYGSLGTVIGTSEPGSGYHFKVKHDVNIDQRILAVIILRIKGKYDLEVVQY